MSIQVDSKLVKRIAELSQLRLSDDEVRHYEHQLQRILAFVEQINSLKDHLGDWRADTTGESTPERDDRTVASLPPEVALMNAPQRLGTAFQVPRIIE